MFSNKFIKVHHVHFNKGYLILNRKFYLKEKCYSSQQKSIFSERTKSFVSCILFLENK